MQMIQNLILNNKKLKLNDFDYNVLTGDVVNYKPADLSLEAKYVIEPNTASSLNKSINFKIRRILKDYS